MPTPDREEEQIITTTTTPVDTYSRADDKEYKSDISEQQQAEVSNGDTKGQQQQRVERKIAT